MASQKQAEPEVFTLEVVLTFESWVRSRQQSARLQSLRWRTRYRPTWLSILANKNYRILPAVLRFEPAALDSSPPDDPLRLQDWATSGKSVAYWPSEIFYPGDASEIGMETARLRTAHFTAPADQNPEFGREHCLLVEFLERCLLLKKQQSAHFWFELRASFDSDLASK